MNALRQQQLAHGNGIRPVHIERLDGRPADIGLACEQRPVPAKMFLPNLSARIKKARDTVKAGVSVNRCFGQSVFSNRKIRSD